MKRDRINYDAMFSALYFNSFIYKIYDSGMFEMKKHPSLAFSPDAIALI